MVTGLHAAVQDACHALGSMGAAIVEVANHTCYLAPEVGIIDPLLSEIARLRQQLNTFELNLCQPVPARPRLPGLHSSKRSRHAR